jgi:integrase
LVAWCEKESVTLTDFTKTHAAQYLQETNNSYGQHARAIFAYAVEQGILDKSPFAKVSRSYTHTPAALMATEHKAILAAHLRNNDQILHLMTQVLYGCFIRPIEQLRLKRSAIDLAAGVIVVDSSISKNKKTQPVVIPDMLRPLLAAYMASTESYTYLFERKGKPYARVDTFQIKHTEAVAALGLPANYKLYSWKHTGAVAAARAGVPLKQLQLQLRHASLDQTDQYLRQMGIADMPDVRKGW